MKHLDWMKVHEIGPYYTGDVIHFDTNISSKMTNPVLIVTAFRDQVLCYEERNEDLKAGFALNTNGPATVVANVYDIVKGDYMVKTVVTFPVL